MSYRCLADFLEELEKAGELVRLEAQVDPVLEAAEITARTAQKGGPALLFGNVAGHEVPLLTNLLGSESRICRAFGTGSPAELAERIAALVDPPEPEGWFERLKTPAHIAELNKFSPRRVKAAPCQQVVRLGHDVDLGKLPVVQSGPGEPSATITAAVVFAADCDTHEPVARRFDLPVLGKNRLAVCWAPHDEHARLLAEYRSRGEQMPIAAVLGGDPALLPATAAVVPPGVNACSLAGMLRRKRLDLVACRSIDLVVPADAEIVIEGHIDPSEAPVSTGPMLTRSGRYAPPRPAPVMHVVALTHRVKPVFPAMVPALPPNETCMIDRAMGRVLLPLVKPAIAEMVDYELPMHGAARHWAVISTDKRYAGQARRVAGAAWAQQLFMFAKVLVIVDREVDVHDTSAVLSAISANVYPPRDVFFEQGPPDPADVAAPPDELGQKMGIDATVKLSVEQAAPCSQLPAMSEEIRRLVEQRWAEYGIAAQPDRNPP